jgi:formamidopyrimidine-DNA glycosylase
MPELPEVETVMRGLAPVLAGRRIVRAEARRPDLRFPLPKDFSRRLEGRQVLGLRRRAKYILARLDSGDCLLLHLGMSGRISVARPNGRTHNLGEFYDEVDAGAGRGPHDHVVLNLDDGVRIVYTDPRRFGTMDIFPDDTADQHKLLANLGVEPLGNEFTADYLAEAFAGKAAPLKATLLDQTIVAGLGNIYVCEALFRAQLSPKRRAGTLARRGEADERLDALVRHIREVLEEAIRAGGSTLRDYARADGTPGAFQQVFAVYDREGAACPSCSAPIKRAVQSGRSTFYCSRCQR